MGARFLLQLGATPKDLINDFELGVGFSLAKREKPFNISAFILGGAGHLDMYAAYLPFRPRLSATVDLSINASASLAISFAGITGGVYAYLGINLNFTAAIGGPSRFVIDARLMFQGVVDIWGIVSASITIEFLLRYNSDERRLVAIGRLRVRIKICWCFTISINMQVTLPPGASAGPDSASLAPAHLRNDLALEFTRARLALLA
jgi:hypothetical protein